MCERTFSSNGHMLLKNRRHWHHLSVLFPVGNIKQSDVVRLDVTHFPLVFRAEVNAVLSSFWVCRQQLGILQLH
jgi:hypothetical protein